MVYIAKLKEEDADSEWIGRKFTLKVISPYYLWWMPYSDQSVRNKSCPVCNFFVVQDRICIFGM
jgi:hypothetical protein